MKSKVLVLILLVLLVGCNNKTSVADQNRDLDIVNVETDNSIEMAQIEKIVSEIENALSDVNDFKLSTDELFKIYSNNMTDGMLDERIKHFWYGYGLPGIQIANGEKYPSNIPERITYKNTKGKTLEQIVNEYKDDITKFIEYYYGDITYHPVEISKVYDDGYFKYVFTKQKVEFERVYGSTITEGIFYKKYVFVMKNDSFKITELDTYEYYEPDLSLPEEEKDYIIELNEEQKSKYEMFKDEKIWN